MKTSENWNETSLYKRVSFSFELGEVKETLFPAGIDVGLDW